MTRPKVEGHQGFLVPNAKDVTKPGLAEPDRIDFNTVAHTRWGVISGCLVTVSGSVATNYAGAVLVDGKLVDVLGGQNVNVGAGGPKDRYDLVGVDSNGVLVVVPGEEALDPVFPDPPATVTVLAAVLCVAGGGNYSDFVVDKRKFLADSLLTKIPSSQDLIINRNGVTSLYRVNGEGATSWHDDTSILRHDVGTLRIVSNLRIDDTLVAGGGATVKNLVATERVIGSNLRNGAGLPSSGNSGDLFQDSAGGKLYIYQDGSWAEVATVNGTIPVGSIITSLQSPANMPPSWVPLDGTVISEESLPSLFSVPALAIYIRPSGTPRSMQLPDARRRVLMCSPDDAGKFGGASSFTIGRTHLPPHNHDVRTDIAGGFKPVVRINPGGRHGHAISGGAHGHSSVIEVPHAHYGADHAAGGGFVCSSYGGSNKLDALFNDRSHTWSVEVAEWTRPSLSGVQGVGTAGSEDHPHTIYASDDHTHQVHADAVPNHDHFVMETTVGDGTPLEFIPAYLSVYYYIRA